MTSIRRRLTLSLLTGSGLAFAVAAFILHASVSDALVSQFDAGLGAKARVLGGLVEREGIYVEFDYPAEAMPEFEGGEDAQYFTLWLGDLPESARSPSLGEALLPRRAGPMDDPEAWDMPLADGRPGRAVGVIMPVLNDEPEDDEDGPDDETLAVTSDALLITVVVATSRADLDARLAALGTGLAFAGVVALLLIGWSVTFSVRRGLGPLARLTDDVGRIDAASLSRRVSDDVPAELQPVSAKLNALLTRLEASFAKERRMTAAMAHELRTPIAELRSASDIARRWPEDGELVDEVVATANDVAVRMSKAVEAVTRYCRLEAGQAEPEIEPVRLASVIAEQWKPYEKRAAQRGVELIDTVPDDAVLESDRGLLEIIVRNLLGNAASFAAPGAIQVELIRDDDRVTLCVRNGTDDLTAQDMAHVSEPFWRKDTARSDAEHSGLGLTLVASMAEVLGYRAAFALEGREFVASIMIPDAMTETPVRAGNGQRSAVPAGRVTSR